MNTLNMTVDNAFIFIHFKIHFNCYRFTPLWFPFYSPFPLIGILSIKYPYIVH